MPGLLLCNAPDTTDSTLTHLPDKYLQITRCLCVRCVCGGGLVREGGCARLGTGEAVMKTSDPVLVLMGLPV